MTPPFIILAAGGTGGHMMPAEAVADVLVKEGYETALVTDKRGEALGDIMPGIPHHVLGAASHMGGGIFGKIKSALSIVFSTLQVRKLFRKQRPSVVVGFGGYPSLPAVLAARSMGIPYVLHEQNAVLGRVNRLMATKAEAIALSVEHTQRVPEDVKTVLTGNPVRELIAKLSNIAYAVPLGFGDIRLFVLGGSQGARILSDVVPGAISKLSKDVRERLDVIHQARPEDVERVRLAYEGANVKADVKPYFEDVGAVLLRTQLVISRSGASTLSELTAMGRPAILVPLSIAADNHQEANARIVEEAGGGIVMLEHEFTEAALSQKLGNLLADMGDMRDWSDGMRTIANLNAAADLAALVVEVAESEGKSK
jgi:UDP-N-acetylglucosamine--N-acetylmuramyl-(pentapeptide) pyrophosphoryl-undecaprenol N-acetylglucosamine transferase